MELRFPIPRFCQQFEANPQSLSKWRMSPKFIKKRRESGTKDVNIPKSKNKNHKERKTKKST